MLERNGLLVINKPGGITSAKVVDKIRRIFKVRCGHAGTLDPDATGILVVALGKATKTLAYLATDPKTYQATMQLGYQTTTADRSGAVIARGVVHALDDQTWQQLMHTMIGPYAQRVPAVSAVHVGGKRLYEYVHDGDTIPERPIVLRTVQDIQLCHNDLEQKRVSFLATVSSGTYIRTLCEDLALKSNNLATMTELIRIQSGRFQLSDAIALSDVTESTTLLDPLSYMEGVQIPVAGMLRDVLNGKKLELATSAQQVIMTDHQRALAIYRRNDMGLYECVRGLW